MRLTPTLTTKIIPSFDHEPLFSFSIQNSTRPRHQFIFLHGMGGDCNNPLLVIHQLLKELPDCQCISYDLRGHGKSSNLYPLQGKTLERTSALDLQAICHYYDLDEPVFIGHSFGGLTIQQYLNLQLTPVPKHVFLVTSPITTPPDPFRRFAYKLLCSLHTTTSTHRSLKEHLSFRHGWDFDLNRLYSDASHTGFINWFLSYFALFGWSNQNLAVLNKPNITFIFGKRDAFIQIHASRALVKKLPKAGFAFINSNHSHPYLNYSKTIVRHILNNLS
jgi:pimeloyl-ACP methyl ester carboxylesterase